MKIGVDMVEIARLARLVRKSRTFAQRTFSTRELETAGLLPEKRREEYLAGRFAVKEAALKALGIGLGEDLRLTEIETVRLASGAPKLELRGNVSKFAKRIGVRELQVSISHELGFAVAFVLFLTGRK
ncbi:MAG TPA: holo-ACP synthase [Candidatus Acidoferrum sp.]